MTGKETAGRLVLLLVGGWRLRLQLEVAARPLQPSRPPDRLLSGGTVGRGGVEEGWGWVGGRGVGCRRCRRS